MAASRTLVVKVTGDTGGLNRAFRGGSKEAKTFGSAMHGHVVGALAAVGRAASYAAGFVGIGLGTALIDGVHLAADNQVAMEKLRTAVDNSGLSWHKLSGRLEESENRISGLSGFINTELDASLAQLVTTTGHVSSAMNLQNAAMNLSRARGKDLASTTTILSKVWNGSTTSLQRLGISLPKVTTAQDALAAKTGTATKAQKDAAKAADLVSTRQAALAALQQKYGGSWKNYAGTASGALGRIRAVADMLLERLGKQFLPYLNRFAAWFAEHLPQIESAATTAFSGIASGIKGVITVGQDLIGFYQRWGTYVQAAAVAVGVLVVAVEAYTAAQKIADVWTKIAAGDFAVLNAVMDANPIAIAVIAVAALAAAFVVLWHRSSTFRTIVRSTFAVAASAARTAGSVISSVFGKVMSVAGRVIGFIRDHWKLLILLIGGPFGAAILLVIKHFGTLRDKAGSVLNTVKSKWGDVQGVIHTVWGWIQKVIDKIGDLLGWIGKIHWPSPPSWFSSALSKGGSIFGIASGGVVTKPTFAMVGEAGPEAVIPLRHLDRYLGRGGDGGGDIHIYLDSQKIATVLRNRNRTHMRQNAGQQLLTP